MIKKLVFLILVCFYLSSNGQYTEIINSNRPGFSESPYAVGPGVYQFETGLFYKKIEEAPIFDNPGAYGLDIHFRTGLFLENFELNLSSKLQNDFISFKNIFTSTDTEFGFGELTIGAKYMVFKPKYTDMGKKVRSWRKRHSFDYKRLLPHIAPYIGVNFGSILNTPHDNGGITLKGGLLFQNEISTKLNIITNVYYNYILSDNTEWSYIITGTYIFNRNWTGFLEHQASFNNYENKGNVGAGIAYLASNDLQINTTIRAQLENETLGVYTGIGASYRIDRHTDRYVEKDEYGNKIEEEDTETYNKGFFGRLIDKITGIFKKKKVDVEITDQEGKTVEKSVKLGPGGRERKKSVLGGIIKEDKKQKKKKTRQDKKADKKAQRKKEKAERKKEKEKAKLERQLLKEEEKKRKEEEKIEREKQKELEKLEKDLLKEEENKLKEEEKLKKEIQELEKELKEN